MYILKAQDGTLLTFDKNVNILNKLVSKVSAYKDAIIKQLPENKTIYNRAVVTIEEANILKEQDEKERIQGLSMTPLDFIKALEQLAGITYEQIKNLCDTYPEIDRELRFCQNVYRNNPMFSQEALAQLPEAFRLTDEQIDNLFIAVDNMKKGLM